MNLRSAVEKLLDPRAGWVIKSDVVGPPLKRDRYLRCALCGAGVLYELRETAGIRHESNCPLPALQDALENER